HSATKYLGGHGTTMGGVVVESGKFPWDNGKFPGMTEPSKGYHGVRFYETFGDFGFTMKARMEIARTLGPTLAPMSAWLLLQGVETLAVRMDRHVANAQRVAEFLAAHPKVSWVNYPGLTNSPYHALARKYMPRGAGGILAFGVRAPEGADAAAAQRAGERFIESAAFMSHLANVGDARTLVIHPASTTHRQLSHDEQRRAGVTPDMIRLSVGLESIDDLLWDIDQALARSSA
ncbi:MAG: PLP-dependent transferase, partial [Burkholderiaceae bacterium]|nr:PLP-dependent transferase [Burkholderiaceae bacterium]